MQAVTPYMQITAPPYIVRPLRVLYVVKGGERQHVQAAYNVHPLYLRSQGAFFARLECTRWDSDPRRFLCITTDTRLSGTLVHGGSTGRIFRTYCRHAAYFVLLS